MDNRPVLRTPAAPGELGAVETRSGGAGTGGTGGEVGASAPVGVRERERLPGLSALARAPPLNAGTDS